MKKHVFPIVIGVISLMTCYKIFLHPIDPYSIISVLVGVIGIIYCYKGNVKYINIFYAWVIMQFPDVYLSIDSGNIVTPIANAFPSSSMLPINLSIGLNVSLFRNTFIMGINLVPIGLYFALKYMGLKNSSTAK